MNPYRGRVLEAYRTAILGYGVEVSLAAVGTRAHILASVDMIAGLLSAFVTRGLITDADVDTMIQDLCNSVRTPEPVEPEGWPGTNP